MDNPNQVNAVPQPIRSAGLGPALSSLHSPEVRARMVLRVALSGVQLPFEVFDGALTRATLVLAKYKDLDDQQLKMMLQEVMNQPPPTAPDVPDLAPASPIVAEGTGLGSAEPQPNGQIEDATPAYPDGVELPKVPLI